jgi:hypothetical protein
MSGWFTAAKAAVNHNIAINTLMRPRINPAPFIYSEVFKDLFFKEYEY